MIRKKSTVKFKKARELVVKVLPRTEYDAILNCIPDIIIRFNLDEKVVWFNKKFEDLISLPAKEILNKKFVDLVKQYDNEPVSAFIKKTIDNGNAEVDAILMTYEGESLYHFKSSLIKSSRKKNNEILIVGRDINDRALLSASLKRSQTQLQKLIDTLPFLIFLTAPDNKYLLINRKYCEFSGQPVEKIIGFKDKEIFPEDIAEHFSHENKRVLSTKLPVHYEEVIYFNKQNVNMSIDKFPLFDENNDIYAICGVAEDITTQLQLQKQVQQIQKMEALGQLTGGIAHDFNNILTSIMGYTSLVKRRIKKYEDETIDGYLNQVTRSGERAKTLVQQLLAFSRGDVEGLQVLDPIPLTRDAIKMLSSLIPSSINLSLKIRNNNVKHCIEVDPVQFHQSIMNLVINSKDSIPDETGDIEVALVYLSHAKGYCDSCHTKFSGKYIRLSVSDTGEGINKRIMGRIFDPFFTTKKIGKGSGMGLSMLHGIVHSSSGHIEIKSVLNSGTTINVYFPEIKPKTIAEDNAIYNVTEVEEIKKINMSGKNILVVDDEKVITNYLKIFLTGVGFKVKSFNDAMKAFEYYQNNYNDLDLVITDQTMPVLTGLEFAKKILAMNHNIPIVLCSGYSDLADGNMTKETGIDVFLEKPFNNKELLSQINGLLSKNNI